MGTAEDTTRIYYNILYDGFTHQEVCRVLHRVSGTVQLVEIIPMRFE